MNKPQKIVGVYDRPEPKRPRRLLWLALGASLVVAGALAAIFFV